MNNLILGTAFGYGPGQIEVFVKSLRKYSNCAVMLVVDSMSEELTKFFTSYNISAYLHPIDLTNIRVAEIFNIRHRCYRDILEYNFLDTDRIFISDVRDVLFQSDPFAHETETELEFFLEPKQIKDCEFNSKKIKKLYGTKFLSKIGENEICCAGTTIGTRLGILKYLDEMLLELDRLRNQNNAFADDQAVHNYLIYNNYFLNYKQYNTGHGPVSTLHHLREGIFNEHNQVINIDGTVVPIVHQWDRLSNDKQLALYQMAVE
jgi:hypothetical protein